MELETVIRLLRLVCGALLLCGLALAARQLSGVKQRRAVRAARECFARMYPRAELAEHLRELTPPDVPLGRKRKSETPCPADWVAREERERSSPYFLRTGQQVSVLATMGPEENWYGLENWIRDLAASVADTSALVELGDKTRRSGKRKDALEEGVSRG